MSGIENVNYKWDKLGLLREDSLDKAIERERNRFHAQGCQLDKRHVRILNAIQLDSDK